VLYHLRLQFGGAFCTCPFQPVHTVTVGDEKFWFHDAVADLSKCSEKFIFNLSFFKKTS